MIDPDSIMIQNTTLPDKISIKEVPEFTEYKTYDLEDEKDYRHFIIDIEKEVRKSIEYRSFVHYLHDNMDMSKCAFLKDINNEESYNIKIELHHYPLSLADIVSAVVKKRQYYNESLDVEMIAKEVMECHYNLIVGLIPLSETVHELYHSGRIFIPTDKVFGRYWIFVRLYNNFIDTSVLDAIERAEKYTKEHGDVLDTTILDKNPVHYEIEDKNYQLPELKPVSDKMIEQIKAIKDNNYLLPTVNDEKKPECPIYFMKK